LIELIEVDLALEEELEQYEGEFEWDELLELSFVKYFWKKKLSSYLEC
jgi:hypothetical protein